jgi:predicted membrane protein
LFQPAIGQWIAFFFREGVSKMPLLNLVVALIVVGMALWLINRYIPMASSIKTILNVVVVVAVGVFVLQSVGLWNEVTHFRVGR